MNTNKFLILIGCMCLLFSSCSDFLDPLPNGQKSDQDLWNYPTMVQGLIGQMYTGIPKDYNNNEGAYLDCATDNAVSTSLTRDIHKFALNTITTSQDIFLTYWDRDYKQIALANTFLYERKGFNTRYITIPKLDSLVRYRLQGEAFGLRAWFYWDLLQKFGGKGVNGQLLGVPIITKPLGITDNVNIARNTYAECVKQIIDDCDSAYKYLPIAYRDFLVEDYTTVAAAAGSQYWGRIDGISTRAIKAVVYLTWASPRFNPDGDVSRWDSAAVYAKKVIDFKLTVDGTTNAANPKKSYSFNPAVAMSWLNPSSSSGIWITPYSQSSSMESMFYPGGFQAYGTMGATQDLVNAFPMKNGYPINDPTNRGGYDPNNPYLNRDPRFYSTIFYNNEAIKLNNTGAVMYTFENWINGGKDAADKTSTNSRTNYYIKKFVFMGLDLNASTKNLPLHSKFLFDWSHMCLAFAEAANHVVGPTDVGKYGMSAKKAIQYLRTRKTTDNQTGLSSTDPYLDAVSASTDDFDVLVKNERRITTCFEGQRFYDIRRWTTTLDELNKPVHGVIITKNENGTFSYDLNHEVDQRIYKSAYIPIPYNEILKMSNLVQNEGWDSWQ